MSSHTIGIAVAVPEPWASEIHQWRRGYGDRYADRMPTHLTILPPTRVDLLDLPAVHDGLRQAARAVPPFTLRLAGTGTFRPESAVVFLDVAEGGADCAALEEQVRAHLPMARPRLHPYRPHVTIAMDVPDVVLDEAADAHADVEITWQVLEVTLYFRDPQGYWHHDRDVPLG